MRGCTDTSLANYESYNHSYQLIKLPTKVLLSDENIFSLTKTINEDDGGTITFKESYFAQDGHTVKIDLKFNVKKHSFEDNVNITMRADYVYAAVMFTQNMEENKISTKYLRSEGLLWHNIY
jgi:hypothetical protein